MRATSAQRSLLKALATKCVGSADISAYPFYSCEREIRFLQSFVILPSNFRFFRRTGSHNTGEVLNTRICQVLCVNDLDFVVVLGFGLGLGVVVALGDGLQGKGCPLPLHIHVEKN